MGALKNSTKAGASGIAGGKPVAKKKASAPKAASPSARKVAEHRRTFRRVAVATVGGFKVFGSPVQPAHRTALQIEAAVAEFN